MDRNLKARFDPVVIGHRVWIGANVTIIGGVTIGNGAVIGAGAVVIRDIPPHTLAVGVPARAVRELDHGPAAQRNAPDRAGGTAPGCRGSDQDSAPAEASSTEPPGPKEAGRRHADPAPPDAAFVPAERMHGSG